MKIKLPENFILSFHGTRDTAGNKSSDFLYRYDRLT